MPDIIKLLPDSVANQIAAGEVVQRPASAVKELLENSVDAGATDIKVVVSNAGKTLIQIIDNGKGMSETDARLCFERHATSKITDAKDLFSIRTKGFRGEALASIASIAHVEIKTRTEKDELGTQIIIEGTEVKSQEVCSCSKGTSILVKNLFFNIPARRNFLKSNPVEFNHILDEFQRIAIAHPEISMSLFHNNKEHYCLPISTNRKQRIVNLFGKKYNERLVETQQDTSFVKICGFVGKPEYAKKTRGEQFFFVNNRFIRHPYLHHSLMNAYEGLLPPSSFPTYYIFFEIDPKNIDINIHPTKTEIKFDDDRIVYAFLKSTVKRSLGKYNLTPSIDFDFDTTIGHLPPPSKDKIIKAPEIKLDPSYNPFKTAQGSSFQQENRNTDKSNQENWQKLYEGFDKEASPTNIEVIRQEEQQVIDKDWKKDSNYEESSLFQFQQKYIITKTKSGIIIVHIQYAHERILFEQYSRQLENKKNLSQQELFPEVIELSKTDATILREILPETSSLGFEVEDIDSNKEQFRIKGTPADIENRDIKSFLEEIIENYKNFLPELSGNRKQSIARSMTQSTAIKAGKILKQEEMRSLIDTLFACDIPSSSPGGNNTFIILPSEELEERF